MQKIIRLYLERDGYTVFTANNGKDAAVLLAERNDCTCSCELAESDIIFSIYFVT